MQEEKLLISLAKSGDKAALAELVKLYESTIYNFAFKICRDKEKAENIMQETFYSMIKSLNQFEGDSKLSTWLYRIVSNHCLMGARKLKSSNFVSLDEIEDDENNVKELAVDWDSIPFKSTENDELKKILDDSIKKLHPDYRVVFLLRDVEGLSTEETASILELTVPAVKSRLHRARAFLRNDINEAFK
ncbi:MAG: sigma-70 family RNA polymerase sigma factor [Bacteroidota bacterium]|nr:sigma-70 family RNA polymerase sigma factor [Bacteroidota bacterium]